MLEEVDGGFVACRREVISKQSGSVGSAGFVAVDAVTHPDNDGGV